MTITCSTKVCSFGKQVVEKVETEYARFENGRFVYRISRSPMCEYMINFIHKLKHLPEKYMMNSVLENFTILQVWYTISYQNIFLFSQHIQFWKLIVSIISYLNMYSNYKKYLCNTAIINAFIYLLIKSNYNKFRITYC